MRARYPDTEGFVERNGAKIFYEVYDNEGPTILLAQSWQTCQSRSWKMQIPYLARHFRVVTYDPIGNGRSDRIHDAGSYKATEVMADAIAVLDVTDTRSCVTSGLSYGGGLVTMLAALHPDRFDGVVVIAASHLWGVPFEDDAVTWDSWDRYGAESFRSDWRGFVESFFDACNSDAHSTKGFDDSVRWAMETTGEIIALQSEAAPSLDPDEIEIALRTAKVPFVYVPLRNHFEQNVHVRARLDRYKAGRLMDYEDVVPDNLASVMAEEIGRDVDYVDVESNGAVVAAAMIGELL